MLSPSSFCVTEVKRHRADMCYLLVAPPVDSLHNRLTLHVCCEWYIVCLYECVLVIKREKEGVLLPFDSGDVSSF